MKLKDLNESSLYKDLQDKEFVVGYLETVLEEGSLDTFLIALRHVAEANGGLSQLAEISQRGRESLYKTLSDQGNPLFSTVQSILKALGMKLSVEIDEEKIAA